MEIIADKLDFQKFIRRAALAGTYVVSGKAMNSFAFSGIIPEARGDTFSSQASNQADVWGSIVSTKDFEIVEPGRFPIGSIPSLVGGNDQVSGKAAQNILDRVTGKLTITVDDTINKLIVVDETGTKVTTDLMDSKFIDSTDAVERMLSVLDFESGTFPIYKPPPEIKIDPIQYDISVVLNAKTLLGLREILEDCRYMGMDQYSIIFRPGEMEVNPKKKGSTKIERKVDASVDTRDNIEYPVVFSQRFDNILNHIEGTPTLHIGQTPFLIIKGENQLFFGKRGD